MTAASRLRALIGRDLPVLVPLALDPLSARLAEAAGFEALYLGGGAMGYVKTGTEANLSLTQLAHAGLEIGAATRLPVILDGTCGWGDPMHVRHTIAVTEAAGFAAIEIEDQVLPKRVHHHIDVEHLVPTELMVQKIEEAVAARTDPDLVIIGRTNACRTDGVDAALRRAEAYKGAGADMLLLLPSDPEQARVIGERIEGPLVYMMLAGPESVGMSLEELGALGYQLVVDSMTPFLAHHQALRRCYAAMAQGLPDPTIDAPWRDVMRSVHEAIGLEDLLEIERRSVERG
jgi:2-methylisocitrate lyase-like PEP mutase family enzyme